LSQFVYRYSYLINQLVLSDKLVSSNTCEVWSNKDVSTPEQPIEISRTNGSGKRCFEKIKIQREIVRNTKEIRIAARLKWTILPQEQVGLA